MICCAQGLDHFKVLALNSGSVFHSLASETFIRLCLSGYSMCSGTGCAQTAVRLSEAAAPVSAMCKRQVGAQCMEGAARPRWKSIETSICGFWFFYVKKPWTTSGNHWKLRQWYTSSVSYGKSTAFDCLQHFGVACLFLQHGWLTSGTRYHMISLVLTNRLGHKWGGDVSSGLSETPELAPWTVSWTLCWDYLLSRLDAPLEPLWFVSAPFKWSWRIRSPS